MNDITEPRVNNLMQPTTLEEVGANFRRYLNVLIKRKWLILGVAILTIGGMSVWVFSQPKVYSSTATVLVDRQAPQVLGTEVREVVDTSMGSYWTNKEYMETQIKVITSKTLALKVAERLQLHQNQAFWSSRRDSGKTMRPRTVEEAASALQGSISAAVVKNANILRITSEHSKPEMAALLANAVAQAYIDQTIDYKLSSTAGAVKWLADQLDDLKKQLESAELALYEFKKRNNIISVSLEDRQTLIQRRIEKLNDALTEIRLKRMSLEARRKLIIEARGKDPLEISLPQVMESQQVQLLKTAYVTEYRAYLALKERYLDKHPLVLEQKSKMDTSRKHMDREIRNILASIDSEYREIKDNEGQLASAFQTSKDEALDLNKREVEYIRLKRNQENTSKLYGMVLTRMKESDLTSQLRVSNFRLLDRAVEPRFPIRPQVKMFILMGIAFGLLLGIALAFVVDTLDSSVKSQEDIESLTGVTFLGLMPRIPGTNPIMSGRRPDPVPDLDLIVHRNPKSSVAESCRSIRTNLLFASTDRDTKTMVVTSPGPREGKTTTAVSLAIVMAQAGSRILIVDTDMRRPRLHKVFGVPGGEGLTTALLGDGKILDLVKTTEIPNLYLLPCGPIPPNPAELCQGERFKALLKEMSMHFDRVILDSPPVIVVTDAVVLSTMVDSTLMVVRTGQTSRTAMRDAVKSIQDVGGRLLGTVLNDMDLEKKGYYRYRRYGYYRYGYYRYGYYGSYYGEKSGKDGVY